MGKSFWIHLIIFVVLLIVAFYDDSVVLLFGSFIIYLLIKWAFQLSFFMKRKWNIPYWLTYGIGFVLVSVFLAMVFFLLLSIYYLNLSPPFGNFGLIDEFDFISLLFFSLLFYPFSLILERLPFTIQNIFVNCSVDCTPDIAGLVLAFFSYLVIFMIIGLIVGHFKKKKEEHRFERKI